MTMLFPFFPFSDVHQLNLDWMLRMLRRFYDTAVFSVNGSTPDENGNVNLPQVSGVTSVNNIGADSAGNVDLGDLVYSVNNVIPDAAGNVDIPIPSDFILLTDAPGYMAGADNTTAFNNFITSGNRYYLPAGIFKASINLPERTELYGAGMRNTTLYPGSSPYAVQIAGTYVTIKDLHIMDEAPYSKHGISCTDNGSYALIENVDIENCNTGIYITGAFIWSKFYNVTAWGCKNQGLHLESVSNSAQNLNTFIGCKFTDNVNEGVYIAGSASAGFCENFYSCNIENNLNETAATALGTTVTGNYAFVNNNNLTLLSGCYFESNGASRIDTVATIVNFKNLTMIGCIFVGEKNICNPTGGPSITTFIGCKDYLTTGTVLSRADGNTKIAMINNDWAGGTQLGTIKYEYENIYPALGDSTGVLDLSNASIFRITANVTAVTNGEVGKVFYIYNNSAGSLTLSGSLFANGQAVELPIATGCTLMVMVPGGGNYTLVKV